MATYKALVLESHSKPLTLTDLPRPQISTGEVLVRILATNIVPYMSEILDGSRSYPLNFPLTPGSLAIGRVLKTGPDAVSLTPEQLVFCDITIRGRDDANVSILQGVHGGGCPAAQRLMEGAWRNSTFAEMAKFPLENVFAVDEEVLCKRRGYSAADMCYLGACMVGYGGLADIRLLAGEVLIVAPATGKFGGAAVSVAVAMGATVIAAGRNKEVLQALESTYGSTGRFKTVALTGDEAEDTKAFKALTPSQKGADAFIDFSPPAAAKSTHFAAALGALRPFGRAAMMGGITDSIAVPYWPVMFNSIRLQGRHMYSRDQVKQVIRLAEAGNLPLGKDVMSVDGPFGLDQIEEALKAAAEGPNWGTHTILAP